MLRRKPKSFVLAALAAVIAVGVYANTIRNGYTFDDYLIIVNNPEAWQWPGWDAFFSKRYFDVVPELSYRPVCTLTYYFDYLVLNGGRQLYRASAHHLSNCLIHAANALLLFLLLRRVGFADRAAFLGAAVFAVHPAGAEAVNGIGFREDMMALGFALATLLARGKALEARGSRRAAWYGAMTLCAVGGLLSKETVMLIPGVAVLCDYLAATPLSVRRGRWRSVAALAVLSLLYAYLRFGPMKRPVEQTLPLWSGDRWHAFLGACNILTIYARLLQFPVGLNLTHPLPTGQELGAIQAGSAVIFVGLYTVAGIACWRLWRPGAFAMAWTAVWVLPVCHVVPIANPMAERFLYAPMAGFAALAGLALCLPNRKRKWRVALAVVMLASYGALSVRRNLDWHSERTLYVSAIRWNPESSRAQNNLGDVYRLDLATQGERRAFDALAETQFRRAIAADPDEHSAFFNMGVLQNTRKQYREASAYFGKALAALERQPHFPWTASRYHHELGVAWWNVKDRPRAVRHLRIALERDPRNRRAARDLRKVNERLRRLGPQPDGRR